MRPLFFKWFHLLVGIYHKYAKQRLCRKVKVHQMKSGDFASNPQSVINSNHGTYTRVSFY